MIHYQALLLQLLQSFAYRNPAYIVLARELALIQSVARFELARNDGFAEGRHEVCLEGGRGQFLRRRSVGHGYSRHLNLRFCVQSTIFWTCGVEHRGLVCIPYTVYRLLPT